MYQFTFDFAPEPKILLSLFMEALEKNRVLVPVPSEDWFYMMIESGEISGTKLGGRYYVYEKSAVAWVRSLDNELVAA